MVDADVGQADLRDIGVLQEIVRARRALQSGTENQQTPGRYSDVCVVER
ncbi:MAG: hypothetical protein ABIV11_10950 [Gemmatimonadaceae bacterium]